MPEDLPRERVNYDLSEAEKAEFDSLERIGEEVSETLEYTPAKLIVIEHVRAKYACRKDGESTIRTAFAQPSPLPKTNAAEKDAAAGGNAELLAGAADAIADGMRQRLVVAVGHAAGPITRHVAQVHVLCLAAWRPKQVGLSQRRNHDPTLGLAESTAAMAGDAGRLHSGQRYAIKAFALKLRAGGQHAKAVDRLARGAFGRRRCRGSGGTAAAEAKREPGRERGGPHSAQAHRSATLAVVSALRYCLSTSSADARPSTRTHGLPGAARISVSGSWLILSPR